MKLRITALIVALVTVFSVGAQNYGYNSTSSYFNSRFGFYITYPGFMYPRGESNNGDGCTFSSSDGRIIMTASATFNVADWNTSSMLRDLKSWRIAEGSSITYTFAKDGKVVLSGYTRSGRIYYEKHVLCKLYGPAYGGYVDVVATARVEYYPSDKSRGDKVISYFSGFPYE